MKGLASLPMTAVHAGGRVPALRALPEEVPVSLVCQGSSQAVMMCSPADLEDFAVGFCLTEGIVRAADEIESLEVVPHAQGIELRMWLRADRAEALGARRRMMAGPVGCGMCGLDSLEQAMRDLPAVVSDLRFGVEEIAGAPEALRASQPMHDRARAVHAAGFLVPGQGIVLAREDVGRHNALDKLIGALARGAGDPASGAAVLTSRVSVEMVQKCAMAGLPVVVAVSAPTALAVRMAGEAGLTLACFAREGGFDLWSGPERIAGGADVA
ncbi:formate dehydrogenase accessory sulfurtransferase FdhD [Pseudooceanicola sp. 216_PA32_1]|uniref:Sulfur carrier protein FdhD n=1 Tax=Pseudooceanicola pacificus TaxID=2676438 RepID=A0A844W648_9RHOB|nr:formate dehydrogenase accessory sulfurtransferase FdhD [Pseudooceanicola pacificus]MWB78545.1 formate dehydrogenase accessory sulfurtransferase FdhD [Pseudooceanicola pacificus]